MGDRSYILLNYENEKYMFTISKHLTSLTIVPVLLALLCFLFFSPHAFLLALQPTASISHITDFPTAFPYTVFQNISDAALCAHALTC